MSHIYSGTAPETAALPIILVTSKDIARMLSCSPRQVIRMATENKIPSSRIGNLVRFDADAVARHLGIAPATKPAP